MQMYVRNVVADTLECIQCLLRLLGISNVRSNRVGFVRIVIEFVPRADGSDVDAVSSAPSSATEEPVAAVKKPQRYRPVCCKNGLYARTEVIHVFTYCRFVRTVSVLGLKLYKYLRTADL